ncbi:hypothetical protein B0T11DRAFT_324417 [Plectosphaerella cucumerina]|uniref:Cytoskeleton-associated protein n=1 Tax=Plectosphaerella cucumerina TaxID=40658 RepID=A0A8K0X919_9PEZI|nr:hypothetical protein B0T11DRAFT_324417 [Plectosphaerella cucumerina]
MKQAISTALAHFGRFVLDERVVLIGIGVVTFSVVSLMTQALTCVRDDNEVKPTPPKTQYITQETEDSLQLDTLDKLLAHSNYSIRDIATKILCDRAVNDPDTVQFLLINITEPEYDVRMQSLRALATLTGQTHDGLSKLHNWKAYAALVRSLELSLTDVEQPKLDDPHWDEYYLRDMAERFCLMFFLELINKNGVEMLVKAKFVEKWLAKQNWGESDAERLLNFKQYMKYKRNRIVDIVGAIHHTEEGTRRLVQCGLMPPESLHQFETNSNQAPTVAALQEILGAVSDLERESNGQAQTLRNLANSLRTVEHSDEEQRLRRQHREAMVFNDGTRPIAREDIIERNHDGSR